MKLRKVANTAIAHAGGVVIYAKEGYKLWALLDKYEELLEKYENVCKNYVELMKEQDEEAAATDVASSREYPTPDVGAIVKCFACALEAEWGTFDPSTGAVICKLCRDARFGETFDVPNLVKCTLCKGGYEHFMVGNRKCNGRSV